MYNSKLERTSAFQTKINQINQFNPALVYGFDPEMTPPASAGSDKWEDIFYPSAGQYEDMLDAYLFAQNSILPIFEKMFDATSNKEEIFLTVIKQLHGFIGNTLLTACYGKSGEYIEQQVIRWNPTTDTDIVTHFYLSGTTHAVINHEDPLKMLVAHLKNQLGMSEVEALQFTALLDRLKKDTTIKPRDRQIQFLGNHVALITKEKLCVAYLNNLLSIEDRALVKKIMTICMDPADVPQAMNEFAKMTISGWNECNKQDIKAVCDFLAEMFYQLTEIHPFGNANGRTATCLLNIFLRSIHLPSILLRYPGERNNPDSSYCKAFECINETRSFLAEHIYQRIVEAQQEPFSDTVTAETIALRCDLVRQLKQLVQKHPKIDINTYQDVLQNCVMMASSQLYPETDVQLITIQALKILLDVVRDETNRLDQIVKKASNQLIGSIILSQNDREQIKLCLFKLTGIDGWKINPKNHLETWIEIPKQEQADQVAQLLKLHQIGKVVVTKRADNQIPVIKCSNINQMVLKDVTELNVNDKLQQSLIFDK